MTRATVIVESARWVDVWSTPMADARSRWAEFRVTLGHGPKAALLTMPAGNLKAGKGVGTWTLGLTPATVASDRWADLRDVMGGSVDLCPGSTPECRAHCVRYSGNGRYEHTIRLAAVKAAFLVADPVAFLRLLVAELERLPDGTPVRLNTFSDIRWERILPVAMFDRLRFYDYTKLGVRRVRDAAARTDGNYRLVLSSSERTPVATIRRWTDEGWSVAVPVDVGRSEPMPLSWHGMRMIDGDATDDRWADRRGVIVGLRAKGTAIGSGSAFIRSRADG